MPERLVDVEKQGSNVLHTFPITISAPAVEEDAFKEKALEAAGNAKLVPNEELESLNTWEHEYVGTRVGGGKPLVAHFADEMRSRKARLKLLPRRSVPNNDF